MCMIPVDIPAALGETDLELWEVTGMFNLISDDYLFVLFFIYFTDRIEDLEMFHFVWPAKERHHTLATVGFIMIIGPHAPALELQARWAVQVFKKKASLPPTEVMMKEIMGRKMGTLKRFGQHKIQVGTKGGANMYRMNTVK